jgi:Protein of unknown function (DUF3592)
VNWFTLTVFVLLPALGTALGVVNWLFARRGVRVTGRIVAHEKIAQPLDAETILFPVVDFSDESGRIVRLTMSGESPHPGSAANAVGASVKLIYLRGYPKRARYDERALYWLVPALCFLPALALALVIAAMVVWYQLSG